MFYIIEKNYEGMWDADYVDENIRYEEYYLGGDRIDVSSAPESGDNRDFALVNGEMFRYDNAVLDSIPFEDIYSLNAEDTYRELVMHDRLSVEMEKSKRESAKYLIKKISPNDDSYDFDRQGFEDLENPYLIHLIDEHFEDENALWDSFAFEIEDHENHEIAIEESIAQYHERDEEPIFWGDEHECWCDEYSPEFDPFDSLDEQYYNY